MTILSDVEMPTRNPEAWRKAEAMSKLMNSIDCGPGDSSCDIDAPCPSHGGDRSDAEDCTPEDDAAFSLFETRRSEVLSLAEPADARMTSGVSPASRADSAAVATGAASSFPVPDTEGREPASSTPLLSPLKKVPRIGGTS